MIEKLVEILISQSPILAAIIVVVVIFGPKLLDFFTKSKELKNVDNKNSLEYLKDYAEKLHERVEFLEKEIIAWRDKYYEMEEYWRGKYYELQEECSELRTENRKIRNQLSQIHKKMEE